MSTLLVFHYRRLYTTAAWLVSVGDDRLAPSQTVLCACIDVHRICASYALATWSDIMFHSDSSVLLNNMIYTIIIIIRQWWAIEISANLEVIIYFIYLFILIFVQKHCYNNYYTSYKNIDQCYFQLSPGGIPPPPRIPNSPPPRKTPKIQKTLKNASNLPPDMCFPPEPGV